MSAFARVSELVWGEPWAIAPGKLEQIAAVLERRLAEPELAGPAGPTAERRRYEVTAQGVAVIPIHGTIAKRGNMFMRASGGVSTDLLQQDLAAALEDPAVREIVLDVDSHGGTVHGSFEAAAAVFAARGRKRITAVANEVMLSAAYLIGSAADRVILPPSAVAGSIGVIYAHRDQSAALERGGIKTTLITAGKYKGAGHPDVPLTADARADLQADADHYYGLFVASVARNRGVTVDQVLAAMADGREFIGSAAVAAGLADGLGTLAGYLKGVVMTVAELRAQYAAQVSEIETAASNAALAAAASAAEQGQLATTAAAEQAATGRERQRCAGIVAALGSLPNGMQAAAKAISDGASVEGAKAAQFEALAAELAAAREAAAAAVRVSSDLPPFAAGQRPAPVAAAGGELTEEQLRAEWNQSSGVQQEFVSFETYAAFRRADAKGKVKVLGAKK